MLMISRLQSMVVQGCPSISKIPRSGSGLLAPAFLFVTCPALQILDCPGVDPGYPHFSVRRRSGRSNGRYQNRQSTQQRGSHDVPAQVQPGTRSLSYLLNSLLNIHGLLLEKPDLLLKSCLLLHCELKMHSTHLVQCLTASRVARNALPGEEQPLAE